MMFVNTGAFIARYLASDQFHSRAVRLWNRVERDRTQCVTTSFVLSETFTLLARRSIYAFAADKASRIYASASIHIVRSGKAEELAALHLFKKFADQQVSFTDCVSFVVMRTLRIRQAFSLDRHFEAAGFKLLGEETA